MNITVYTDGASRGNPGPSSYGLVILDEKGSILYQEGEYIGKTTNNVAEYTALLKALEYVKKHFKPIQTQVFVDSKLVAEQLSGRFKIKAKHLKPLIEKIQLLSIELGGVIFSHIPREKNTLADRLANQALDSR